MKNTNKWNRSMIGWSVISLTKRLKEYQDQKNTYLLGHNIKKLKQIQKLATKKIVMMNK